MVDIWWVVLAFVCGGYTGMLMLAVVAISRQDPGPSALSLRKRAGTAVVPGSVDGDDPIPNQNVQAAGSPSAV